MPRKTQSWDDAKVAYYIHNANTVWKRQAEFESLLPKGWELIGTDGRCFQLWIIFRVETMPNETDGQEVRKLLRKFGAYRKPTTTKGKENAY